MIRKGLKPGLKIGLDLPTEEDGFRRVMPFSRSWIALKIFFDVKAHLKQHPGDKHNAVA